MRHTAEPVPRWARVPTPPWPVAEPARPPAPEYLWAPRPALRRPVARLLPNLLLLPYAICLFLITWLPASQAGKVTGIVHYVARLLDPRVPYTLGYPVLEFLANVALFVPLGILLSCGWPRLPWWAITLVGFVTTVTIECVQWGIPSRFPAISDIVSNTLGTMIGAGLVVLVAAAMPRGGSNLGR